MERPLFDCSIDELELEFEAAKEQNDRGRLTLLAHELQYRKTPRARDLETAVADLIGSSTQGDEAHKSASQRRHTDSSNRRSQQSQQAPGQGNQPHAPTPEQEQAIAAFSSGGSLKINAFAGTGKTSTLIMLARATGKRGQYLAFNRKIVDDARARFPRTVNCSTSHGLAFNATPSAYRQNAEKMTGKLNANRVSELLKIHEDWRIDQNHSLRPMSQGALILRSLQRFTHSEDLEPTAAHVPLHGSLITASQSVIKTVQDFAVRGATYLWSRMQDQNDPVPLGHDGYLKLWALSNPTIGADFILMDEAQDTNPVVLDVLRKQQAQMIYVGDRYQQIYEWRGALNAMEEIDTQETTTLTESFRFGDTIAQAATKVLRLLEELRPMKGNPSISSFIRETDARTVLARTNAVTITAIMEALDKSKRPHLVGGNGELLEMLRAVEGLKRGQPSTVAEFFGFENWMQVVEFAKSGEGEHLLTFVNLVESRGEKQLMWALNRTVDEDCCDVVISTAHKAKGREWPTVRLMDDFLKSRPSPRAGSDGPEQVKRFDPAELRLFYVALTRARLEIEVPQHLLSILGMDASKAVHPKSTNPRSAGSQASPKARQWSPPENWEPPQRADPVKEPPPTPVQKTDPRSKGSFTRWLFGN